MYNTLTHIQKTLTYLKQLYRLLSTLPLGLIIN